MESIAACASHLDKVFIDGKWAEPASRDSFEVVSAHSEGTIATVAAANREDVARAALSAKQAFDEGPWTLMTSIERAAQVRALGQALAKRLPDIQRAWVDQTGALAKDAPFVVGGGHFWFEYYASLAERYSWDEPQELLTGREGHVVREAAGVTAAIAPWNNPFGIMAAKVAPALVAGCTVVMKPAPETPLETYMLAEAAEEIGLPAGVLNLVCADREASELLVRNRAIDKVSFTGSVAAGRAIGMACAERFARCTLELGGKSAAIVLEDADIDQAGAILGRVITMSAGQICATLSRVVAVDAVYDRLLAAIEASMAQVRVGHPDDPSADMGPLAMERQRDRVEEYVAVGRAEGGRLIRGGTRTAHMDRGWYYDPTLFADVTPGMRIAREEIFGPVLTVLRARDEEEAIRIANDSDYGLFGAVFCEDSERAYRVSRRIRTGTMAHNGFNFDPYLPFGGFKSSGIGREGGKAGLDTFTEIKAIIL